jgi:hypothetical protein
MSRWTFPIQMIVVIMIIPATGIAVDGAMAVTIMGPFSVTVMTVLIGGMIPISITRRGRSLGQAVIQGLVHE